MRRRKKGETWQNCQCERAQFRFSQARHCISDAAPWLEKWPEFLAWYSNLILWQAIFQANTYPSESTPSQRPTIKPNWDVFGVFPTWSRRWSGFSSFSRIQAYLSQRKHFTNYQRKMCNSSSLGSRVKLSGKACCYGRLWLGHPWFFPGSCRWRMLADFD